MRQAPGAGGAGPAMSAHLAMPPYTPLAGALRYGHYCWPSAGTMDGAAAEEAPVDLLALPAEQRTPSHPGTAGGRPLRAGAGRGHPWLPASVSHSGSWASNLRCECSLLLPSLDASPASSSSGTLVQYTPDSATSPTAERPSPHPSFQVKEKDEGAVKKGKSRTAFSQEQLQTLHQRFQVQKYLSPHQIRELAASLGLTYKQVNVLL